MAFTLVFRGEEPIPSIVCDGCCATVGVGSAGYVLVGPWTDPSATHPGAPPVAFVMVPPSHDDGLGLPSSLRTILVACSDVCRVTVEELITSMSGGHAFQATCMSLGDYLDRLREVLDSR